MDRKFLALNFIYVNYLQFVGFVKYFKYNKCMKIAANA